MKTKMTPMEFLKSNQYDLIFCWIDKTTWGYIDDEEKKIYINLYHFAATTFIHEFMHFKYPKENDEKITERGNKLCKRMSARNMKELGRALLIEFIKHKRNGILDILLEEKQEETKKIEEEQCKN